MSHWASTTRSATTRPSGPRSCRRCVACSTCYCTSSTVTPAGCGPVASWTTAGRSPTHERGDPRVGKKYAVCFLANPPHVYSGFQRRQWRFIEDDRIQEGIDQAILWVEG